MAYTQQDLTNLRSAMASGLMRCRFGDSDTTFRSLAEMERIETKIAEYLGETNALATGGSMLATFSKGV